MTDHAMSAHKEQELLARIEALEKRMERLEKGRKYVQTPEEEAEDAPMSVSDSLGINLGGSKFEMGFGEFGLAWLGNLVLFFGIVFLMLYLHNNGLGVVSTLLGYLAVLGIFLVGHFLRKSFSYMASTFRLTGYVLLFYVTATMHFIADPLLQSKGICLALLLAVTGLTGFMALRKKSQGMTALAAMMAVIVAIMSDSTHVMLPLAVVVALASVIFMHRFGWARLLIFSILIVYFTYIFWLLGNPLLGHPWEVLEAHGNGYLYVFVIAAIYSYLAMLKQRGLFSDSALIGSVILNGAMFSFLVALFVLAFFKESYVLMFASIAVFCLLYSVLLQKRSAWKLTASLYALYSFVAISVMLYGLYDLPRAYLLLSIQSILVITMALWFRSKVIVVLNLFLFVMLLIAYLASVHRVDSINFSFGLVALVSARILNWKRERLEIKTELLRNSYLMLGFLMVLYAFYQAVPVQYVTLSWTAVAAVYFILSIVIRNVKYRYLALSTMFAAAVHLFIRDLANVDMIYRVLAFLFLAVISIALSFYYVKKLIKKTSADD